MHDDRERAWLNSANRASPAHSSLSSQHLHYTAAMADRYRAVLLFGAPGVGKGTQGKLLGQIPGIRHLATGDMFRSMDKKSPLAREVLGFMSRGELVPDELTVQLWQQHVKDLIQSGKYSPTSDLLVLDGIPRS